MKSYGTLSANGESEPCQINNNCSSIHVHVSGAFGGGTATLQFRSADGTWRAVANGTFTSAVDKVAALARGSYVRLALSGATSPSVYYEITTREFS